MPFFAGGSSSLQLCIDLALRKVSSTRSIVCRLLSLRIHRVSHVSQPRSMLKNFVSQHCNRSPGRNFASTRKLIMVTDSTSSDMHLLTYHLVYTALYVLIFFVIGSLTTSALHLLHCVDCDVGLLHKAHRDVGIASISDYGVCVYR